MRIKTASDPPSPLPAPTSPLLRLGKLSVGELVAGKNEGASSYPKSTDYFQARGDEHFEQTFAQLYGTQPQTLRVMFASDDPAFSCEERLELRDNAGKLYAYGDGETCWFYKEEEKAYTTVRHLSEHPQVMEKAVEHLRKNLSGRSAAAIGWKPTLYLRVILPEFPALGYWQFVTHAEKTTIPNLRNTFDQCLADFGTVRLFAFKLMAQKVKSNRPGAVNQYTIVSMVPLISMSEGMKLARYMSENPQATPQQLYWQGQHLIGPGGADTDYQPLQGEQTAT